MKKSWWKILLVLAVLAVIAGVVLLRGGTDVEVTTLTERELVERLVVTGTVEPAERADLSAEVPGRVLRIGAREGDSFSEGEVLVFLDSQEAEASLRQAEASLEQARARLRTVRQQAPRAIRNFEEATVVYEGAREEMERAEELVAAGVQPQAQLDQRRREFDRARVGLDRARTEMEEASPQGSAVAEASAQIRQAQAGRDLAAVNLANHEIRAPFDGVVLQRSVERGQTVQPGAMLLLVAASGRPEIRIDPDEREIANLTPGLSALVLADAFPDHPMEAELDRLHPAADRERATVAAFLRLLDDPPEGLRSDMTVSADIELRRREDASVLPVRALRGRATSDPYVLVADEGQALRRSVSIGLVGDDYVEIVDGLSTSDQVILTTEVTEGDRVRP